MVHSAQKHHFQLCFEQIDVNRGPLHYHVLAWASSEEWQKQFHGCAQETHTPGSCTQGAIFCTYELWVNTVCRFHGGTCDLTSGRDQYLEFSSERWRLFFTRVWLNISFPNFLGIRWFQKSQLLVLAPLSLHFHHWGTLRGGASVLTSKKPIIRSSHIRTSISKCNYKIRSLFSHSLYPQNVLLRITEKILFFFFFFNKLFKSLRNSYCLHSGYY